jgi:hypothetical protein
MLISVFIESMDDIACLVNDGYFFFLQGLEFIVTDILG